jgi:hypothetical protein
MTGVLVVSWILGGSFVALLVLNAITSSGSSAMAATPPNAAARRI